MLIKFRSVRPTIFVGVLAFAALSLAACQPVAILMPQTGAIDQAVMPNQSLSDSLTDKSIAVASDTASNPDVNAFGYYVRAPGYLADESNAGVSNAASNPDVNVFGYYVRAPGYLAEALVSGVIDVAATPYLK